MRCSLNPSALVYVRGYNCHPYKYHHHNYSFHRLSKTFARTLYLLVRCSRLYLAVKVIYMLLIGFRDETSTLMGNWIRFTINFVSQEPKTEPFLGGEARLNSLWSAQFKNIIIFLFTACGAMFYLMVVDSLFWLQKWCSNQVSLWISELRWAVAVKAMFYLMVVDFLFWFFS